MPIGTIILIILVVLLIELESILTETESAMVSKPAQETISPNTTIKPEKS